MSQDYVEPDVWNMPEELRSKLDENLTGWINWNPNNAICSGDGLSDCDGVLEFLWVNGEVVGYRCPKCGNEGVNEK